MTGHEDMRKRLDDYVAEVLTGERMAEVDAHLSECVSCRAYVLGVQELLVKVEGLPKSVEPPRDLWRDVSLGMGPGRWGTKTIWSARYQLAAAALVIIVASSAVTIVSLRQRTDQPFVALLDSEDEYARVSTELEEIVTSVSRGLTPETMTLIRENLRIIDDAIRELRTALATEPSNDQLQLMLVSSYERKLDLLRRVRRMSQEI